MYNRTMNRTNIYLPEKIKSALDKLSKETGLSMAELVRRAIDEFLKKQ